jgi:hypothetical protein
MTEEAKPSVKRWREVPLSFGLLDLIYVLSIGPAYRFLRKGVVQQHTFSSLYAPMLYVSDRCRPFYRVMDWHLTLWYSDERELIRGLQKLKSRSE